MGRATPETGERRGYKGWRDGSWADHVYETSGVDFVLDTVLLIQGIFLHTFYVPYEGCGDSVTRARAQSPVRTIRRIKK